MSRAPTPNLCRDLGQWQRNGAGKVRLPEQGAARGSISAAGRAMRMSERRAGDLVTTLDSNPGMPVIETPAVTGRSRPGPTPPPRRGW